MPYARDDADTVQGQRRRRMIFDAVDVPHRHDDYLAGLAGVAPSFDPELAGSVQDIKHLQKLVALRVHAKVGSVMAFEHKHAACREAHLNRVTLIGRFHGGGLECSESRSHRRSLDFKTFSACHREKILIPFRPDASPIHAESGKKHCGRHIERFRSG